MTTEVNEKRNMKREFGVRRADVREVPGEEKQHSWPSGSAGQRTKQFNKSFLYLLGGTALWKHPNTLTTDMRAKFHRSGDPPDVNLICETLTKWKINKLWMNFLSCVLHQPPAAQAPCYIWAPCWTIKTENLDYLLPQGELPPSPPGSDHSDTGQWIHHLS